MPDDGAEDVRFFADLIRAGGCDADALCVDHFPHHATGAVGVANEYLGLRQREIGEYAGLVNFARGNLLQAAEGLSREWMGLSPAVAQTSEDRPSAKGAARARDRQ